MNETTNKRRGLNTAPLSAGESLQVIDLLISKPTATGETRTQRQTSALKQARQSMVHHGRTAGVTEKQVAIIGYLMRNPGAIIMLETNVLGTLEKAKECLKMDVNSERVNRPGGKAYDGTW